MDVNYWNSFADKYNEMVTDAFTYGRSNIIAAAIDRYASRKLDAADYGCGPGKTLPFLANRFRKVYGYDFSNRLLKIARERCKKLKNVEIVTADLAASVSHLTMVDVAISLNAAIMPDMDLRLNFLRGMASRLKQGGHLLMNVPSVESLLYSSFREIEWYRRGGRSAKKAERLADVSCISRPRMMAQGVLYRSAEPTKHYLREELIVLVRDEMKLDLIEILKTEYDWKIEMEDNDVPEWMSEPYPWDWLVIAKAK